MYLQFGSTGDDVQKLQKLLGLPMDGIFGEATKEAVVEYQRKHNLEPDGIVGPKTWASLTTPEPCLRNKEILRTIPMEITPTLFPAETQSVWNSIIKFGNLVSALSKEISIDPAVIHAVIAIESQGEGMVVVKGNLIPLLRFETHVFHKKWGQYHPEIFNKYFSFDTEKPWTQQTYNGLRFHGDPELEWSAFDEARKLSAAAAYESISIGLGQIMGFHWKELDFMSSSNMFYYNQRGERQQLLTMFEFISRNPIMLNALRTEDWLTFAQQYNGTGQAEKYETWLRQKCNLAKTILGSDK